MKMWSLRVIILLLFCYACLSSDNRNVQVRFISTNFHSMLHWDAADPATAGPRPLYTVKYKIYKDYSQFETKAECENIFALTCDLTNETALDYNEHYLAKVLVNGQHYGYSTRFKPTAHTHLGPPILSTSATSSSLHVNVTLPLGPNNSSVGDIISGSRNSHSKTEIIYTLQITEPAWAAQIPDSTTGSFAISFEKKATEFCGFVSYRPSSEEGRHHSDRAYFCVPVQHKEDNPLRLLLWLLVTATLSVVLLTLVAVCICHYVKAGKGVNTPEMLKTTSGVEPRVMQPPDTNIAIYKLEVRPSDEGKLYQKIKKAQNLDPPDGYCPQDIPIHHPVTWNSSGSSSRQSSVIYSIVEGSKQEWPPQIDGNNLRSFTTVTDQWGPKSPLPGTPDSSLQPLVLDAVRDADGKLLLTLHLFGDEDEAQRMPFLSNSECCETRLPNSDDSGCDDSTLNTPTQPYLNSHYCPSGPQGVGNTNISNYKQSWMPENFIQPESECGATRVHYPRDRSGLKQAEDDEEDEALVEENKCMTSEILLSSWMVQVQD